MMKIKSFCCCGLRTAGLVFGYLGIVGSLFVLVVTSLCLNNVDEILKVARQAGGETYELFKLVEPYITIILIVWIVIGIIQFVASLCLIIGTVKRNHYLIIPWLVKQAIILAALGIYMIGLFITICFSRDIVGMLIFYFIIVLMSLLMNFFIWVAIYSLFVEIKESRQGGTTIIESNEQGSVHFAPSKIKK